MNKIHPTDLLLMIKRSKPNKYKDKPNIPEPLVDPFLMKY